jgi:hypothetical protein
MTDRSTAPKCGAKLLKRDGACTLPAGWGTQHQGFGRCRKHLGTTPNLKKAAERERVEHEARAALQGITDFEAISDPVLRLQMLAGRAERFMEVLGERVVELRSIRYAGDSGEQLRAEVGAYERAMTATGRLLVDLARLGLDERQVRLNERLVQLVNVAITGSLTELGLTGEQMAAARPVIARQLRTAAGQERARLALPVADAQSVPEVAR